MLNEMNETVVKDSVLHDFFEKLCQTEYTNFEELIKEFGITYESLLPFATWSKDGYKRICLASNEEAELILICWTNGQETAVHNHSGEKCWMYFAKGEFVEKLYANDEEKKLMIERSVQEGEVSYLTDDIGFHSLHYSSEGLGMTMHLYANPIKNCQVYSENRAGFVIKDLVFDVDLTNQKMNAEMKSDLSTFMKLAQGLIVDEDKHPVSTRIPAHMLKETLSISLCEDGIDEDNFTKILKEVVLATPKTSSNLFFNQLFGGRESKAVLGDLLAVMLNNSMYTYKVGGVQVGIEKEILDQVIQRIDYGPDAGGTIPTGGSMSNFMAMLMARDKVDVESRSSGVKHNMIAYTSAESHYSIEKNAAFVGIGKHNVRKIPSNDVGEMDMKLLAEQIEKDLADGHMPFFVNATAGTTVIGAFDDFVAARKVCNQFNIWMHIDGAYKGSVIFSDNYKHLVAGVNQADSFSLNPHKMLGTPLTCSIILVKDKKHLLNSFSNSAEYLYQTDEDEYNLGKTSFQCGRRNDALKLWTLWKSKGRLGLEQIVDKQFYLAEVAREYIINHPDYTLYSFDESISVCFNYKDIPADELCTGLYESNELMVGYGQFRNTEFVRMVTINSSNNKEDILNFFAVIENFFTK
jgi:sulfinoalanine decarboxylase/sulfinoalanine decarboxylase/aspartate 1-decarboxylase